jgi:hypothetical protein
MSAFYTELRPCYTSEATYSVTVTIDGAGTIAGQTFAAALFNPDGTAATGTPTATVSDAANRKVLVTLPGQAVAGEFPFTLRRTDDASSLVVAHGIAHVTKPGGQV